MKGDLEEIKNLERSLSLLSLNAVQRGGGGDGYKEFPLFKGLLWTVAVNEPFLRLRLFSGMLSLFFKIIESCLVQMADG